MKIRRSSRFSGYYEMPKWRGRRARRHSWGKHYKPYNPNY